MLKSYFFILKEASCCSLPNIWQDHDVLPPRVVPNHHTLGDNVFRRSRTLGHRITLLWYPQTHSEHTLWLWNVLKYTSWWGRRTFQKLCTSHSWTFPDMTETSPSQGGKKILRVTYDILDKHVWVKEEEGLLERFLNLYYMSIVSGNNLERSNLKKGLEVCLRNILRNISNGALLTVVLFFTLSPFINIFMSISLWTIHNMNL